MNKFSGTGVALVTPFKNGKVDYSSLEKIIEHVIKGGVDYLVSLGSTGEASLLTDKEQREVLDFTIDINKSRKPLVAGNFGGSFTDQICHKIDQYNLKGIDAILSACPSYVRPNQAGLYAHYKHLATHSKIPLILYNVPSRTATNLSWETTLKLAKEHSNIIGIKEASNDLHQCAQIAKFKADDFLLISGDDEMTLPILALGGNGVISVAANAFPNHFSSMVSAALQRNQSKAIEIHQGLLDLHQWLYKEGNPTGIKAALQILDLCSNEVRLPLVELSGSSFEHLKKEIQKIRSL